MKQQTAVNFLYEFVQLKLTHKQQMQFEGLFQQAKQIEKQQSKQDYDAGLFDGTMDYVKDRLYKNAEQYYNETYKQ